MTNLKLNQNNKGGRLLKPKYDVVFQSLFSDKNRKETGYFISAILNSKVRIIKVNTEYFNIREIPKEKIGRLDLIVETEENEIIHIELQLLDNSNTIPRLLYYLNQNLTKQLSKGDEYIKIKRTITILGYDLKEIKDLNKMHTIWNFREKENNEKELTNLQELHIIQINKAKYEYMKNKNNILAQWILFILDPNEKEVKKIMTRNKEIKETTEKLENLSDKEQVRKRAEILARWELDERWNKQSNIEYGKYEKSVEIAKKLLKRGMQEKEILEITNLKKEQLEEALSEN